MPTYLSDKKVANARSLERHCSFTTFLGSIIRTGVQEELCWEKEVIFSTLFVSTGRATMPWYPVRYPISLVKLASD